MLRATLFLRRLAITKSGPILDAFEKIGVDVGSTHRNEHGFNILLRISGKLDSLVAIMAEHIFL